MDEVWVAEVWKAHGYSHGVHAVYGSREAAFEALRAMPNMTVYVDAAGEVRGRPRKERVPGAGAYLSAPPEWWAHAHPMMIEGRVPVTLPE